MTYPGDTVPALYAPSAAPGADPRAAVTLPPGDTERLPSGLALIRADRARPAPRFSLRDESGAVWTPDTVRGRVVRLEIWATWCSTCRAEFPQLQRLHEEMSGRGVLVLGVCRESERAEFEQAVRKDWVTFPVVDANRDGRFPFPVGAFPTSVVLDREGRVRASWQGWRAPEAVDEVLLRLLEEPADGTRS